MRFVFTSTSTSWKESSCRKKHRAAPSPQNHTVLLFLCSKKYLKPQWISGMHRLPGALVFCGPQQYDLWLWKCEHSFCQKKLSFSDKGNIQIPVRPVTYTVGSIRPALHDSVFKIILLILILGHSAGHPCFEPKGFTRPSKNESL